MTTQPYICSVQNCGAKTSVTRTISFPEQIVRERKCENGHDHETRETRLDRPIQVLRSANAGGRVEPWDRDKARKSILQASGGVLRAEAVDDILSSVIRALQGKYGAGRAIPTRDLGEEIIRQLRTPSASAAVRYATKFYPSRPEPELRKETVQDLIAELTTQFKWQDIPRPLNGDRPLVVKKKPRTNQGVRWQEDFELPKLWVGLAIATKGMLDSAKWQPSAELSHAERSHRFTAAIVSQVLAKVAGQSVVSSGQLSAACIEVLAEVHPLAAVRYSTTAKNLDTRHELLLDLVDMAEREAKTSAADVRARWDRLDDARLDALIAEMRPEYLGKLA